ncbi:MAG: glycyl-radical enzyme activating protein [Clostridia bacterium]|nr:glycyl-radical enzyme activating protein [Clostridia bacterium]
MEDYLNVRGRIFDIQKFSVHDGPGVRTIVFLKGCVLRCRWCCNPESQRYEIEQMQQGGKLKTIGRDVTVGEVMDEVDKDRIYYAYSGGGLTLSGGECLCQPEFAEALLHAAKEYGYSTAIESTACAPIDTIRKLLPYLDTYLMDIKHVDPEKHKAFTTRDNGLILENARILAKEAKHLIIRVPVIPTFNDTPEEIAAISKFVAEIMPHGEINLLPYHRLGLDKYAGLGRPYTLDYISPPTDGKMQELLAVAEQYGLQAKIGG